ncbi:MAG: DUF357 domain-containing protein, partial [Halobacteriaceae archaeon]
MSAELEEKVERYEGLLADALESAETLPPGDTPLGEAARDFEGMARSYLEDGRHFRERDDLVN